MTIEIENQQITLFHNNYLNRNKLKYSGRNMTKAMSEIDDHSYYINFDLVEWEELSNSIPMLNKYEYIICDFRGYPNLTADFIPHLLKSKDTAKSTFKTPHIIYPDQSHISTYRKDEWALSPVQPRIASNLICIINGEAISQTESYLNYFEGYDLAVFVGEQTAGTNGSVNSKILPGNYEISYTGQYAYKLDGSRHYSIGVEPDVPVKRTIKGIREGRDEFLEKAISLTQ